jgi:hypothetical protein
MVNRLLAVLLIVLAIVPFTEPFAAYDTASSFDASSTAAWSEPGSNLIDGDSTARIDIVFGNPRIESSATARGLATVTLTFTNSSLLRPLTSTNATGTLFALSSTLRI